jgi:methylthioribulose-1-phosphate dehydratase
MEQTALINAIHFLHQKGFAPATSSNYSVRMVGCADFWVSESGVDKGGFTPANLIQVDSEGLPINDTRTTSAETDLHTTLYKLYPDAHCILHTHSIFGTVLSDYISSKRGILLENYELLKAFEGIKTHETRLYIPIFENTQHIPNLSKQIIAYQAKNADMRAFLIEGHGMYTWASSVAAAKMQVEAIEFLLECAYRKMLLVGQKDLLEKMDLIPLKRGFF